MIRRALLAAIGTACLAACAAPAAAPQLAPGPTRSGPAFEQALSRVDGPFEGYLDFVDTARLAAGPELPGLGGRAGGQLDAYRAPLAAQLKIDLDAAGSVLTAGRPPRAITLVSGGQDAAEIRTAATAAGWTGGDTLGRQLSLAEPLTLQAGTVRPIGSDVVVGAPDAAVALVDGAGPDLQDDPVVGPLARCLGDVLTATLVTGAGGTGAGGTGIRATGVGLRRAGTDPARADSVLCVAAGATAPDVAAAVTEAVRSGKPRTGSEPYSAYLTDPQVEQLDGGIVRLIARTPPGAPVTFLISALQRRELPGLAG
ncbi:hypothetical protein [Pseudonocardia sp. GCM10023141]|uniref:hypothetical protein n=1 Tax=Pseudonocardia sp. GCM10023141 TaxID=3252653 RepID=UPI00360E8C93